MRPGSPFDIFRERILAAARRRDLEALRAFLPPEFFGDEPELQSPIGRVLFAHVELRYLLNTRTSCLAIAALQCLRLVEPAAANILAEVVNLSGQVDTRIRAVWCLGRNTSPKSVTVLLGVLNDPDLAVRSEAVVALGRLRAKEALPELARIARGDGATYDEEKWDLSSFPITIVSDAEHALALIRGDNTEWVDEDDVDGNGVDAEHESERIAREIAAATIDELIEYLRSSEDWIRWEAAERLGHMRAASAVPGLIGMLNGGTFDRDSAGDALLAVEGTAPEMLRDFLESGDAQYPWLVLALLGRFNRDWLFDFLMGYADSSDRRLRKGSYTGLGNLGDARAAERLMRAIREDDLRDTALSAFAALKDPVPVDRAGAARYFLKLLEQKLRGNDAASHLARACLKTLLGNGLDSEILIQAMLKGTHELAGIIESVMGVESLPIFMRILRETTNRVIAAEIVGVIGISDWSGRAAASLVENYPAFNEEAREGIIEFLRVHLGFHPVD